MSLFGSIYEFWNAVLYRQIAESDWTKVLLDIVDLYHRCETISSRNWIQLLMEMLRCPANFHLIIKKTISNKKQSNIRYELFLQAQNNCILYIVLPPLAFFSPLGVKGDGLSLHYSIILGISSTQGWEFAHLISQRIARFLSKNEQMSNSLKKMSDSLIRFSSERPERIAHGRSFLVS